MSRAPAQKKRLRPARAAQTDPRGTVDTRALLDAASKILSEEGPAALSMRRVASEAGTSTMVLYTRFGSREGLMEQLLVEGFTRFANELGAVAPTEPFAQLRQLGLAYRRFAKANPTYYPLMWAARPKSAGRKTNAPSSPLGQASQRSFGALVHTITRVLAATDRPARDVEPLAVSVWSTVHGFVSLELAGAIPAELADAAFEQAIQFIDRALRPTR